MTREKQLDQRIKDYINAIPGCMCRKRHGGKYGTAGDPDLYGSLRGRHFEWEDKRPGEKPKTLQLVRLAEWQAAGAVAGWSDNFEDAKRAIDDALQRTSGEPVPSDCGAGYGGRNGHAHRETLATYDLPAG